LQSNQLSLQAQDWTDHETGTTYTYTTQQMICSFLLFALLILTKLKSCLCLEGLQE